jgi:hypothetical protein
MNLLTFLFRLPLLPVRSFVRLGTLIEEEVNREMASPARVRRELERAERARAEGEISGEQAADFQQATLAQAGQAQRSIAGKG